MKVPDADLAEVSDRKLIDYLLSESHPDGWSKARFFNKFGFKKSAPVTLKEALLAHIRENDFTSVNRTRFGVSYIVDGQIMTPIRRNVQIRSIWFIETGTKIPKLTTAYPLKGKRK